MSAIIKLSIDLTKIPKDKVVNGKKGKYINLTYLMNDQEDEYGNHGGVIVEQTKEEREQKAQRTYLGNGKVVWSDGNFPEKGAPRQSVPQSSEVEDDDLPF